MPPTASAPLPFFTRPRIVFLLASLCCLLWGSAYPAIKQGYALLEIGRNDLAAQLLFAGYRFVGAGALLLVFAKLSGKSLVLHRAQAGQVALLGVLQTTLQYIFFYIGLAHTTGVKGSILNASGVFFSVLLAHFVYHNDTLTWRKITGCALGFAGVLAVNLGGLLGGGAAANAEFSLLGEGFIVLAALVLSAASLYGKRISQGMDSVVMTGYQLGMGGVALVAIGWVAGGRISAFGVAPALLLGYMAVLSAVAFALWSVLLKFNRVSTVAVYSFLVPVFGACLSALFLGESLLEWKYLVALLMVSVGIWWVSKT
ncbi:DMT family transporter [Rhodoferax saidenbachensis]|uniref:DMT family transporter n=1 Tax=Rhodoferax saidenbachensis TaxID=1484693 RepID=UPI0004A35CFF|nr:DMT family transporter [Rhodoferax saidenbachensis]